MQSGKTGNRPVSAMPPCVQLDIKCLNRSEQDRLFSYFTQCRWLCNHLLSLDAEEFRLFDTKTRDITSLDKDGNPVARQLTIPAKFIQSVYSCLKRDMSSLASKRNKTGKRNGKLKFRSEYNSIDLNQYRDTHWICYMDEGDKNGKYRNTVHIAGIRRPVRVFGMEQIPDGAEYANARFVKRASGIYLMLTCYVPVHEGDSQSRPRKERSTTYRSENRNASGGFRRSLPARRRVPGAGMLQGISSGGSMRSLPIREKTRQTRYTMTSQKEEVSL